MKIWIARANGKFFDHEKAIFEKGYINWFYDKKNIRINEGDIFLILRSGYKYIYYSLIIEKKYSKEEFLLLENEDKWQKEFWKKDVQHLTKKDGNVIKTKLFRVFKSNLSIDNIDISPRVINYCEVKEKYFDSILKIPYYNDKELKLYKYLNSSIDEIRLDDNSYISNKDLNSNKIPEKIEIKSKIYKRNIDLKLFVLKRARNICEYCKNKKNEIIWIDENKTKSYLEVHHIDFLSENGKDTLDNVIALCPNCHKKAHHSNNKKLIKVKMKEISKELL